MDCVRLDENKICSINFNERVASFLAVLSKTKITTPPCEELFIEQSLQTILNILKHCRAVNATVYIVGNGGSAAIASHAVIDFINMSKMRATALLDPAVTTCVSNDYGYEYVYSKQLSQFIQKDDVLIAVSSSGNSKNIINAVNVAHDKLARVITLSGFSEKNLLRQAGHYNLWLNSRDYGQVEIGHAFILHYLTDRLRDTLAEEVI